MWILVRNFNHQLEKVVGCKVIQFIPMMKIKNMLGHKTLRCTNIATSSQEWWIRENSISGYNLLEQTLLNTCETCEHFNGPWNKPFICLRLWEKKTQTHNHELKLKQNWNSVFHKPWQIPYLSSCYRATGFNNSIGLDR